MNIDTSAIEGFEGMSDADKVSALLGYNIPDPDYSGYVSKETFDKKASEAASLSKQLKEAKKAGSVTDSSEYNELKTMYEEIKSSYDSMAKDKKIAEFKAEFISQGYEDATAAKAAEALFDNNTQELFKLQKEAQKALEKKFQSNQMRHNPNPNGAGGADNEDPAIALAKSIAKSRASTNLDERLNSYRLGTK